MLAWVVCGWIIAGGAGFIAGVLCERYIRKVEQRWRTRRQLRREMGDRAEDDTKVTKLRRDE